MDGAAIAWLTGLALVDSTSVGTLVLPVMMLVRSAYRPGRVVLHLMILAGFYFGVGMALWLGGDAAIQRWSALGDSRAVAITQLTTGVLLVGLSFVVDGTVSLPGMPGRRGERLRAWQRQALGSQASARTIVLVALSAGVIEVLSLVPYLVAVAMLIRADAGLPLAAGSLGYYVGVMSLPGLVLVAIRLALGGRANTALQRLGDWFDKHSANAMGWAVGIIGVLLALDAWGRLGGG